MARPRKRPILIYDGECGFCAAIVDRYRERAEGAVDLAPSQEAAPDFSEIPAATFERTVVFIDAAGAAHEEAAAAFRFLAALPGGSARLAEAHARRPWFRAASDAAYRFVAGHRPLVSRIAGLLWGPSFEPSTFNLSRRLFLRLLALVYLIAFVSLWVQVDGLAGDRGILPAADFLARAREFLGAGRFWSVPTLMWLRPEASTLGLLCGGGTALSVLSLAGFAPVPVLVLLWVFYLSLVSVSGVFLGYQWDNLLLEAGLLAVFYAPTELRPSPAAEARVPALGRWLIYLLLFKLMFSSGIVKLLSGDPAWKDLTALAYHYETQCLPTPTAWYAHHLPLWFHKFETFAMFAVELVLPFFILVPRRPRLLAGAGFIILMGLIALTGNYTFFNLLTAALALTLFDDRALRALLGPRLAARFAPTAAGPREPITWAALRVPAAALLIALNAGTLWTTLTRRPPRWFSALAGAVSPLRSVNGYGLFAVMTKSRPEIVIEGTRDGRTWEEYGFKWKAGRLDRAPGFVAPHQPRLDWQMWFGALGSWNDPRTRSWFLPLMARLLEASPPVLRLLEKDPFAGKPPLAVRALRYDYRFTGPAAGRASGDWWTRTPRGAFSPVLTRR